MKVRISLFLGKITSEWHLDLDNIPRVGDEITIGDDVNWNKDKTAYFTEMIVRGVRWDFGLKKDDNDYSQTEHEVWIYGDPVWESR